MPAAQVMADVSSISGNPGAEEAAAIGAVIAHVLAEEAAVRSQPPVAPRQSAWVLAWRPRVVHAPLPSHTYGARPWSELDFEAGGDDG